MFLTIHSTTGIVIGQAIANPIGAFLAGVLSHYILDAIPHGDEGVLDMEKIGFKTFLLLAIADHIFVIINFAMLFLFKPDLIITAGIIAAILGAMLPDWLGGSYGLIKKFNPPGAALFSKMLKPLDAFHRFCHREIIKPEISLAAGIILQILSLAGFWWLIS